MTLRKLKIRKGILKDLEGKVVNAKPIGRPRVFQEPDCFEVTEILEKRIRKNAPKEAIGYVLGLRRSVVIDWNRGRYVEIMPFQYYKLSD